MAHKILSIAVFSLSLIFGQASFAHSHECGEGMKKIIGSLHLDSEQKAKVIPILDKLKATMKENVSQMKDLRMQINQQVTSDTMDQATVDSLIDKKVKLIGDMMKAKAAAKNQIYGMLNAQQKAQHQKMMTKMQEKMSAKSAKCEEDSE